MFYRFLIKVPIEKVGKYPNVNGLDPIYDWDKIAFSISWTQRGNVQILCFDIPSTLQSAITQAIISLDLKLHVETPIVLNNIIIEEVVAHFDKSVWLWRNVVRDLEKVLSTPQLPMHGNPVLMKGRIDQQ
jgi:hypothetical protein